MSGWELNGRQSIRQPRLRNELTTSSNAVEETALLPLPVRKGEGGTSWCRKSMGEGSWYRTPRERDGRPSSVLRSQWVEGPGTGHLRKKGRMKGDLAVC